MHADVETPHRASLPTAAAYLWPTCNRYELLRAVKKLLDEHRFPYDTVHSVELELANAELLEPFHPLCLLLRSLRSVSLRVDGPIVLGREMYNRLRMLRSTVTTLGINYTGPSGPDTSPEAVFVDRIVCGCSGANQGTSVLPDMYWVNTLLLRLADITVRPVRHTPHCIVCLRLTCVRTGQDTHSPHSALSAAPELTHGMLAGHRHTHLRFAGPVETRRPGDAAVL